jgi:S-DNA-T family DNA segregation ATPase FtsK/SpoIIIE
MSKKNRFRHKREMKIQSGPRLHPETKISVLAITFLGISAILILGSFGYAGPAGKLIFNLLFTFLGLGYYLIPTTLVLIAANFLVKSERPKFVGVTLLGAVFFILAGLGTLDVFSPGEGGLVGKFLGGIQVFFGYWASLVINLTVAVAAVLITLNTPIRIAIRKAEEKNKPVELPNIIIPAETPAGKAQVATSEIKGDKKEKEIETKEVKLPKVAPYKSSTYVPPPLDLLKSSSEKPTAGDLRANANIIKRTLENFGVPVEMGEITIGPKVTRYTLKPAEGVKLSRITALNQDLSLALAAHPIRIEAPIPGKSLVGIEVPNKIASIVRLGSLLGYPEFANSAALTFPLGRDVSGEPIFTNLSKMPHLLIAGATGSGKSTVVHTLLTSLLYKNSPDTLRLILVDPKRIELSIYDGIPHLAAPVITEGKKAISAIRFGIEEMERRYQTLLEAGKRDIESYNEKYRDEPMPYLVIVIDELADLMAAFGREIESYIVRLAQMARATGIHLVVTTQRPSVDVITGLIKANITARIALQVASQVDSRTILDTAGAEKLLGGGDMLFISGDLSKPKRIQGAYVSEDETDKVINFIRDKNPLTGGNGLSEKVEASLKREPDLSDLYGSDDDELYAEAVDVVKKAGKASASLLQRRLKVGYARAARLLDIMEARGVIGPGEGAKPREVFIERSENEHS